MEPDLDCTGLRCPEPVLRTRKKIESSGGPFTVLVDNPTARDNVSRFARSVGGEARVEESGKGFMVFVTPPPADKRTSPEPGMLECPPGAGNRVVLVTADEIGKGEDELGRSLMKMFLFTSAESDTVPSTLIFMNSGVRLVTENEEAAAHVRVLEDRGAEVLVCGTCLDYYGLGADLKAGRVSNMYEIQQAMISADLLVSL